MTSKVVIGAVRALVVLLPLTSSHAADVAGNLIVNGGFEAGLDYRVASGRWFVQGPESWALDTVNVGDGRQSIRVPYSYRGPSPGGLDLIQGAEILGAVPILLKAGTRYSFTAKLRSSHSARGRLLLTADPYKKSSRDLAFREIVVGERWQRYAFSVTAKESGPVTWRILVNTDNPGDLWVDSLRLQADSASPDEAKNTAAVTLASSRPGHIFPAGEIPALDMGTSGLESPQDAELTVIGLDGREVFRTVVSLIGGPENVQISIPVSANGVYRARATIPALDVSSQLTFSILPEQRRIAASQSAFGIYGTVTPVALPLMGQMGFRWLGNLGSNQQINYWRNVEPTENQFLWYDSHVALARQQGFEFMFNLEPCRPPKWAKDLSVERRRELWVRYVTAMVTHYRDQVRYWTIGDEVHSGREAGSEKSHCWTNAREYAAWHRAGYQAIKAADPDAQVIMNTWNDFAGDTFASMPAASTDIIAMNAWHIPASLARIRSVADAAGLARRWAPGVGVPEHSFYPELTAELSPARTRSRYWLERNRLLTRSVIETFGLGFERLFQYNGTFVGNTNLFSLFEADGGLKPTGAQFATLAYLLDGFKRASELQLPTLEPNLRVFRFDRIDGKAVFALWGAPVARQRLLLPKTDASVLSAYDRFANPVSVSGQGAGAEIRLDAEPHFVVVNAANADSLAEALRRSRISLDALPESRRQTIQGRYAVLDGVRDLIYRREPNRSLWYRRNDGTWVEVFRSRSSFVQPEWTLDSGGLTLAWRFQRPAKAFFLEPGMFPTSLVGGASFERLDTAGRPSQVGTVEDMGGKLAIRNTGSSGGSSRPAGSGVGDQIVRMRLSNGLTVEAATKIKPTTPELIKQAAVPGGWEVRVWTGREAFLHYVYPAGLAAPLDLTTRVSVGERL